MSTDISSSLLISEDGSGKLMHVLVKVNELRTSGLGVSTQLPATSGVGWLVWVNQKQHQVNLDVLCFRRREW